MSNERIHRSIRRAMSHRATLSRAAFLGAAACVTLPAVAAESGEQAGVEEIIVTASRRETNLQDTPIAVTAFTQAALDRAQATDLAGLQSFVPNLTVEQHGDSGGVHVYLRGIGSANHTELGDPAVAFHVDEVYSPRPQGATVLMHDLASSRSAARAAGHAVRPQFHRGHGEPGDGQAEARRVRRVRRPRVRRLQPHRHARHVEHAR